MATLRTVFVEDSRGDGKFLRTTWHPERRTFVVSTWDGSVCVGATRLEVTQVAPLVDLLARGLADAAAHTTDVAAPPLSLRAHLTEWWRDRTRMTRDLPPARALGRRDSA